MNALKELVSDENNIAFHPMMGNSYQLNTTGREILELLQKNTPKEKIVDLLHEKYGIDRNELYIDVSDFISKLRIYGLYQ